MTNIVKQRFAEAKARVNAKKRATHRRRLGLAGALTALLALSAGVHVKRTGNARAANARAGTARAAANAQATANIRAANAFLKSLRLMGPQTVQGKNVPVNVYYTPSPPTTTNNKNWYYVKENGKLRHVVFDKKGGFKLGNLKTNYGGNAPTVRRFSRMNSTPTPIRLSNGQVVGLPLLYNNKAPNTTGNKFYYTEKNGKLYHLKFNSKNSTFTIGNAVKN
jgi:ribosomal protein S19E (S16A)